MPNILLITVDDMEGKAPGVFGGIYAPDVTPNIDQLAGEGMRFEKAHVAVAVCQPSRQTIMTGKYPLNIDAMGFTPIGDDVTTLGQLLANAGYINGTYNKEQHLQPRKSYVWSYRENGGDASQGRSAQRTREMTEKFIDQADQRGAPFFLMANMTDPHAPFYDTEKEHEKWPNGYVPIRSHSMRWRNENLRFQSRSIVGRPRDHERLTYCIAQHASSRELLRFLDIGWYGSLLPLNIVLEKCSVLSSF
jgi:N-sulfoglucosamine sulfohydrolase